MYACYDLYLNSSKLLHCYLNIFFLFGMRQIQLIRNTCLVSNGSSQGSKKSIHHLNVPIVRNKAFNRSHITYIVGTRYTSLPTSYTEHNLIYIYKIHHLPCRWEEVHVKETCKNVSEIFPCFIIFQLHEEMKGKVLLLVLKSLTLGKLWHIPKAKDISPWSYFCNLMQNVTSSCTLWREKENSEKTSLTVLPSSESSSCIDQ